MSEDSLIAIDFEGKQVRMVGTPDRPEWVAADVCKVLGIKNTSDTLSKVVPESEKGVDTVYTLGGQQQVATVTEPGLYRLIFKSRKVEAERFRDFVFGQVLPCIRKYGCFPAPRVSTDSTALVQIDPHELMVQMGETFRQAVFQTTEPQFKQVHERFDKSDSRMDEISSRLERVERRKNLKEKTKRQHVAIVTHYGRGMCPCCKETQIIADGATRLADLQFDHWLRVSQNGLEETWPVCQPCNLKLREKDFKKSCEPYFEAYQQDRVRWQRLMDGPSLFD